jgi:mannose-6-phosphate isomerase-like protein (cupin superfamily)
MNVPPPRRRVPVLLLLAACLLVSAFAQSVPPAAPARPLLESKTVTQSDLQLEQHPFVFDGVARGLMAQYFNGRTAGTRGFVVGNFQLLPGAEPHPIHQHADHEILIVGSGDGEIICDGKTTVVTTGSAMYTAPNVPHGIRNTGKTPLTFYFIKWVETPPAT